MTTPPVPPPYVAVAGLLIPADLALRIIRALRAAYPAVVGDRDDEGAVRSVLLHWITATLAAYEGSQVEAELGTVIERVRTEHLAKAHLAREKAVSDAARIREVPSGASDPNVPQPDDPPVG